MNFATWAILIVIAALLGLAIRHIVRTRKSGGCPGCGNCSEACSQRKKES